MWGIYATFHDDYRQADECMTRRCHTHIFWRRGVLRHGTRMGGQAPHLGLMVTAGEYQQLQHRADEGALSNDRGDFILHPVIETIKTRGKCGNCMGTILV